MWCQSDVRKLKAETFPRQRHWQKFWQGKKNREINMELNISYANLKYDGLINVLAKKLGCNEQPEAKPPHILWKLVWNQVFWGNFVFPSFRNRYWVAAAILSASALLPGSTGLLPGRCWKQWCPLLSILTHMCFAIITMIYFRSPALVWALHRHGWQRSAAAAGHLDAASSPSSSPEPAPRNLYRKSACKVKGICLHFSILG